MNPGTIMARLTAGKPNDPILRLASDVAAQLGARKLIGIAACQPMQYFGGPGEAIPPELVEQDYEQMAKDLAQAEKEFRSAFSVAGVDVDWRCATSTEPLAGFIAREMRAADLLVTAPSHASLFDSSRYVELAATVMAAGRPVLVAGPEVARLDLGHVLVAWKDSREARRAVEDALPLLKRAGAVTVAEIAPEDELAPAQERLDDVAAWLRQHGITSTTSALPTAGDDASRLAAMAEKTGAAMVVAGAYGHSRLAEWVLGGMTRDFLLKPSRCSFVSH
jgi:nucleotide-binding universal stress UspA family protein